MPYVQARRHTLGRHPAQGPPQILASRRRAPYFLVGRRCQRQQEHMGMLTMRYLLAYYSGTTSQWRSLDTDLLPQQINRAEELPAALENAPMIALSWMLERRPFGSYQATVDGKSDECVMVYELEPTAASPLGNGTDYVGPWLEMFMQTNEPIGTIALGAGKPISKEAAIGALRQLASTPLQASDEACQQTIGCMREYAPSAAVHAKAPPAVKKQETA